MAMMALLEAPNVDVWDHYGHGNACAMRDTAYSTHAELTGTRSAGG